MTDLVVVGVRDGLIVKLALREYFDLFGLKKRCNAILAPEQRR
ncbi:MAG: hypothetical protein ACXVIS_07915 [Halobacteriota archaeon]